MISFIFQKLRGSCNLFVLAIIFAVIRNAVRSEQQSINTSTEPKETNGLYKNTTGHGHYYGGNEGHENYGNYGNSGGYGGNGYGNTGYGPAQYGNGYGNLPYGGGVNYGQFNYGYNQNHHLVDDYICDVDASILVVTNSENSYSDKSYGDKKGHKKDEYGPNKGGYKQDYGKKQGGYGQNGYGGYNSGSYGSGYNYGPSGYSGYQKLAIAHRLRCSVIAIRNDSVCTTCCQLAARRDKSIAKERIIGFIVDNNQIHLSNAYRKKREAAQPPAPPTSPPASSAAESHDKNGKSKKESGSYDYSRSALPVFPLENPRCVCCAPKHHYDNHYVGDYGNQNEYQNNYGSSIGSGYGFGNAGGYGQPQGGYIPPPPTYGAEVDYGHLPPPPPYIGNSENAYGPPQVSLPSYGAPPPPPPPPPVANGYGNEKPNYHSNPYQAPYKK